MRRRFTRADFEKRAADQRKAGYKAHVGQHPETGELAIVVDITPRGRHDGSGWAPQDGPTYAYEVDNGDGTFRYA